MLWRQACSGKQGMDSCCSLACIDTAFIPQRWATTSSHWRRVIAYFKSSFFTEQKKRFQVYIGCSCYSQVGTPSWITRREILWSFVHIVSKRCLLDSFYMHSKEQINLAACFFSVKNVLYVEKKRRRKRWSTGTIRKKDTLTHTHDFPVKYYESDITLSRLKCESDKTYYHFGITTHWTYYHFST